MPRARTSERRENQLISLAYDLAEQQIREGTVSAQVLASFIKMGSAKDRLERRILSQQEKLVTAKTKSIESDKKVEELYTKALKAMRKYNGMSVEEEDEDL